MKTFKSFLILLVLPLVALVTMAPGPPSIPVSNTPYGSSWNGKNSTAPSQNAVYDKIQTIVAGAGDVATDSIWDAAGDLAVGTGADTAAKLSKGAEGTVLTSGAATLSWQAPTVYQATDADLDAVAAGGAAGTVFVGGTPGSYTANPAFSTLNLTGAGLTVGTGSATDGKIQIKNATNNNIFTIKPGATGATLSWTLPIAAAGGNNFLLNVDADGTMAYTDPASLGGAGYTNLTSFVDQTAWRMFYSDGSGDVKELALGSDGTYLRSNGASSAPTFDTPSGAAHDAVSLSTDLGNNLLGLSTQQLTLDNQNANVVFAGPTTGSATAPTFRSLVALDIPDISATYQPKDTELTALAGLTFADSSIIQLTGTGAAAVLTSGGNNYFLGSNSDNTALEFKTPAATLSAIGAQAAGSYQTSHASLTSIAGLTETNGGLPYGTADNTYAWLAAGAAGKVLQGNGAAAPSWSTPTYPSASGTARKILISDGTNNVYSTETWAAPGAVGAILYSDGTNWARLAAGTDGYYLKAKGAAAPEWATVTAATPTAITVADTTDSTSYFAFFESATGDLGPKTDAGATYDASTGSAVFTGSVTAASFTASKSSGVAGDASLYEANSTDTDAAGFRGPDSMTGNTSYRLKLPSAKPSSANMFMVWATTADSGDGTPASPYAVTGSWLDADSYALADGSNLAFGSDARGDIAVRGATAYGRIAKGSSGAVLTGDGTDTKWSTFTLAAPGTSGNFLKSDGTNWTSSSSLPKITSTNYAATTSAELAGVLSDETGSGKVVYDTSPAFTTDIHAATAGGATAGTAALPFGSVYIGNAATNNIQLTGTAASAKTVTIPGQTGTVVVSPVSTTTTQALFATATSGLAEYRAIAVGDLPAATTSAAGISELAIASEVNTGTSTSLAVTPDALAGSYAGTKDVCWTVYDSDTATAVADGKKAYVVPASLVGMNLIDLTCSVHDLNSASGGTTTVVLRRVRGATAVDMTSTGVTIDYNAYTASDETVDTANDDLALGDKLYIDVNAVTTGAAQKGLSCTALFQLP